MAPKRLELPTPPKLDSPPVSSTARLAWRAVLAIVLMLGFYALALAMIAGLVAVPIALAQASVGLAFKVGVFCVVGAFVVLNAMLPRRDRFEPPGPQLTPETQPRLFKEIRSVAAAVRQPPPAEVYLVADVNAWVGHRGGLMGFGSRRVMGLGLPLLQVLRVPELRGVIAHEFGHFHGGDVAIGPWIYKTSSALVRTVGDLRDHSEFLTLPFIWYGNLFFRVTHAVSRHQEVLADRLAADVVGARALASGLRETQAAAEAFVPYWHGAVAPVLSAGFVPPLAAGFDAFLKTPWVVDKLAETAKAEPQAEPNPYDTHPPLPDRLAALGASASVTEREPGPLALSLLDDVPSLEARLIEIAVRKSDRSPRESGLTLDIAPDLPALTPLRWDEVGTRVWLPGWRKLASEARRVLPGVTPSSLPELDWKAIGLKVTGGSSDNDPLDVADTAVGVTLALVLIQAGFTVESHPASPPALVGPEDRVEIFGVREELAKGPEAVERWRSFCARAGIADVDLGSAS